MKERHYQDIYDGELSHWWYRVRREIIHSIFIDSLSKKGSLEILDVGCGPGALLSELSRYGNASGIDMSEQAVGFCHDRGISNVSVSSVESITAPDNSFDLVLALDVLEHVKDDHAAAFELYRVLKPGGTAVIFVPAFMFLWGITDVLSEHYRRYTRKEICAVLTAVGFSLERSSYFNTFLFLPIATVRLAVRLFRLPMKSENAIGISRFNSALYQIFHLESKILRYINMPFGVSVLVIARKPYD